MNAQACNVESLKRGNIIVLEPCGKKHEFHFIHSRADDVRYFFKL